MTQFISYLVSWVCLISLGTIQIHCIHFSKNTFRTPGNFLPLSTYTLYHISCVLSNGGSCYMREFHAFE